MFQDIVQIFTRKMKKKDKIRIIFEHRDLKECIDLPFVLRDDFTAELLMQAFESVMQSYLLIIINTNDIFSAKVQIALMPIGTGKPGYVKPGQGQKKKRIKYIPVVKLNNKIISNLNRDSIQ